MMMTNEEIIRRYREAENLSEQIRVLADLNYCGLDRIKRIVGVKLGKATARINYYEVERLYRTGLNDREIAAKMKCSLPAVTAWRGRQRLPPRNKRGRKSAAAVAQ